VDGTGSGLCLLLHFHVNSVETVGCFTRELLSEMGLRGNLWRKEVNGSGSGLYPLLSCDITFCVLVPASGFVK